MTTEFDRYQSLNTARHRQVAYDIAVLALDEERKTGKATLYMTSWDIASELKLDVQLVRAALRLSYTAQFLEKHGFGFVAPGSGRGGHIYGYKLQHGNSAFANSEEQEDALDYQDAWALDHLSGIHAHYTRLALAYGAKTALGKATQKRANLVQVAIDAIGLL